MEGYTTFKKSPCHLGDYMVPGTYHLLKKRNQKQLLSCLVESRFYRGFFLGGGRVWEKLEVEDGPVDVNVLD